MKQIILIFLFFYGVSLSQISPGELSNAHSHLEGLSNCTKCHTLGEGLANQKCLDCHTEIKVRQSKRIGYHSSKEVIGKNCWTCHSDHNGKEFRIVNLDKNKFDHLKTGYELTGKHKYLKCGDCHQKKFIVDVNLKKFQTFLGLDKNCFNCHEDIHKNTAGKFCEDCHNTQNFSSNIKFDHNQTSFPLIDAHSKLDCTDCHKKSTNNLKELKFVNRAQINCTDCHNDVHNGKFGSNCLQCHSFKSFTLKTKQKFDHSKTNFPLIGMHQFVDCKECHKVRLTIPLKHTYCYDCHSDYHNGQFVKNNSIQDCSECHTEYSFSPSLFTIENHQKSKFTLNGAHLAIECKSCHYSLKEWRFKLNSSKCNECHENVHKNEISSKFMGINNCERCHNTSTWKVQDFDHSQTKFILSGKHLRISCSDCHIKNFNGNKVHQFKSLKSECLTCHENYHYDQYSSDECINCHSFEFWNPVSFDHNNAKFKLIGAHEKVECTKCHPSVAMENGSTFILYKTRRLRCVDCHSS